MKIIGREREKIEFQELKNSKTSEFVVVYGRRRVGKTFLIREFFKNKFDFYHTGILNSPKSTQLQEFNYALNQISKDVPNTSVNNWFDAFHKLEFILEHSKNKGKKIIFLDEMPWMATQKSGFMQALDLFWNKWASARKDILLIVCGSATSWLFDNIINNTGGMHNRITQKIHLKPFSLLECETFFKDKKVPMNRRQICETYMVFGGIPLYLNFFKGNLSVAQNIDNILFSDDALLKNEFSQLYRSLFSNSEKYIEIVKALGTKVKGLTRKEILKITKLSNGGGFSEMLNDLELSGFIRKYYSLDKKEQNIIYQLSDFYTLFYFNFIENQNNRDENYWTHLIDNQKHRTWSGYSFEQLCLEHLQQIKQKLGISGVLTNTASWLGEYEDEKAQIDLLIDRNDGIINLCEMKFSKSIFIIDKNTWQNLMTKTEIFRNSSNTTKAIHLTMITPLGIKTNKYSGDIHSEIKLEDLFKQ